MEQPIRKSLDKQSPEGQKAQAQFPARYQLKNFDAIKLNYAALKAEKENKYKSGRKKGSILGKLGRKSIQDWVDAFNKILDKATNDRKAALKILKGLKETLQEDRKSDIKSPDGEPLTDQSLQDAYEFYDRWIKTTDAHIEYIEREAFWLDDFRSYYLNAQKPEKIQKAFDREMFIAKLEAMRDGDKPRVENKIYEYLWDRASLKMRKRIEKVLGNNLRLKALNSEDYFLEAITYGGTPSSVAVALKWWYERNIIKIKSEDYPFEDWIRQESVVIDQYKNTLEVKINYFRKKGPDRQKYRLTVDNGKVYDANGTPLKGTYIYVLSSDGELYGGLDKDNIHHSSFLAGKPVICAGELVTNPNGSIKEVNTNSGHYEPSQDNLNRARAIFKQIIPNLTDNQFVHKY